MSATVAASLITGLLSLAGVVLSNLLSERRRENALRTAQAVTDEQLRELTRGGAQVSVSQPFYAPF